MDSLTQAVLGAAIGGAIAPSNDRRRALVAGALLGTLPDLDVFIDFGGAVENYTYHRGFSHSLLVLVPFSVLLWFCLRKWWAPVQNAPNRWFALISLTLVTHTLLDAHTAYGTQLFWPFDIHPIAWATLFIIDPLYTLPLLIAVIVAMLRPLAPKSASVLRSALVISTLYIAWSWAAFAIVHNNVHKHLANSEFGDAPVFVTPTPFNTFLWRIVVLTDEGYLEAFDSLLVDEGPIQFETYDSNVQALEESKAIWAVDRLRWFSRDFLKAEIKNDSLILTDLRMGQEPSYVFAHVVAASDIGDGDNYDSENGVWNPVSTELLPTNFDSSILNETWSGIWGDIP